MTETPTASLERTRTKTVSLCSSCAEVVWLLLVRRMNGLSRWSEFGVCVYVFGCACLFVDACTEIICVTVCVCVCVYVRACA